MPDADSKIANDALILFSNTFLLPYSISFSQHPSGGRLSRFVLPVLLEVLGLLLPHSGKCQSVLPHLSLSRRGNGGLQRRRDHAARKGHLGFTLT